jgi:hypothetical protein
MKKLIISLLLIVFCNNSFAIDISNRNNSVLVDRTNSITNSEYTVILSFNKLNKRVILPEFVFFEKPNENSLVLFDIKTEKPYSVKIENNDIIFNFDSDSVIKYQDIEIKSSNDVYINNKPLGKRSSILIPYDLYSINNANNVKNLLHKK